MERKGFFLIMQMLTMAMLGLCIAAFTQDAEGGMLPAFICGFLVCLALTVGSFFRRRRARLRRAAKEREKNAEKLSRSQPKQSPERRRPAPPPRTTRTNRK